MRLWVYVATSAAVYCALMADALVMYPNYYSAMVGMSDSAFKLLALVNFSGSMTILCTKLVAWLLFDGLNAADQQTISGRALLISTVVIQFWTPLHRQLALNSQAFLVGFLFLLALTALHWICFNRVKSLQTVDPLALTPYRKYKIAKLGVICVAFFATDIALCLGTFAYYHSHELTGSFLSCVLVELVTKSVLFTGMYAANLTNMVYLVRNPEEDEWDRAQLVSSVVKMASSVLGVLAHLTLIRMYGLSIVRIWLLLPYFFFAYGDAYAVHKALTAHSELNKFTTNATDADLARDNTCVICREEMTRQATARRTPKRLNCGHVMHMACLHSWLARSGSCPTCRQSVYSASSSFHPSAYEPAPAAPAEPAAAPPPAADLSFEVPPLSDADVEAMQTLARRVAGVECDVGDFERMVAVFPDIATAVEDARGRGVERDLARANVVAVASALRVRTDLPHDLAQATELLADRVHPSALAHFASVLLPAAVTEDSIRTATLNAVRTIVNTTPHTASPLVLELRYKFLFVRELMSALAKPPRAPTEAQPAQPEEPVSIYQADGSGGPRQYRFTVHERPTREM